jgi:GT2 family glycosyltransferase
VLMIAAIIVNWNGKKDTLKLLSSLESVKKGRDELITFVVDNGSDDGSPDAIRNGYPGVRIIETGSNLGFAAANNIGIRQAMAMKARFFWILNNDTYVDCDALSLAEAFNDGQVGAAGSKIYFAPGKEYHSKRYSDEERGRVLWYAGGLIDWKNMYASHRGVDEVDSGQYDVQTETDFVTGCSMMLSDKAVRQVGLFDERYFLYFEDVDLSLRIKQHGLKTVYMPDSVVWHVNAGSSGGPGSRLHEYYLTRNRLLAGMKYAPLRTKFALVREAAGFFRNGGAAKKRAVSDALMLRFGKSGWTELH